MTDVSRTTYALIISVVALVVPVILWFIERRDRMAADAERLQPRLLVRFVVQDPAADWNGFRPHSADVIATNVGHIPATMKESAMTAALALQTSDAQGAAATAAAASRRLTAGRGRAERIRCPPPYSVADPSAAMYRMWLRESEHRRLRTGQNVDPVRSWTTHAGAPSRLASR